ncbi:MAG: DUF3237 domain-containing protein [Pseudomonadales bacterium]
MQLEYLLSYRAVIGSSLSIGASPAAGDRSIARVTGGTFEGPGLKGTIVEPGADWVRRTSDGFGQVDVRLIFATDDDAHIYVTYTGLLEFSDKVMQTLASGAEMQFGDSYFATQIRFETGSDKYAYLNNTLAVGEGRLLGNEVEYRCYRLIPGGA